MMLWNLYSRKADEGKSVADEVMTKVDIYEKPFQSRSMRVNCTRNGKCCKRKD